MVRGQVVCNGHDKDCDGALDNDPAGGPLSEPRCGADGETLGVCACAEGARSCMNTTLRRSRALRLLRLRERPRELPRPPQRLLALAVS